MARIIATACIKGGIGKTTTTASLGGILADRGKKVLLVDLDPQYNLTSTFFADGFEDTVAEAFERRSALPVVNVRKNLDLVPSSAQAVGIETRYLSRVDTMFILRSLLAPLKGNYDFIFLDCPAHLGVATGNALVAADFLLIPMTCDAYASDGLRLIMEYFNQTATLNSDIRLLGVFLNKFHRNRKADSHVLEMLSAGMGKHLFESKIRDTSSLVNAPMYYMDVWTYDRNSAGAQDYCALLDEMLRRIRSRKL